MNQQNSQTIILPKSSDVGSKELLQKLMFFQIKFDDMMQFSSRLVKENESLQLKNHELHEVIGALQENSMEGTKTESLLRAEIHDLRRQCEKVAIQLRKNQASVQEHPVQNRASFTHFLLGQQPNISLAKSFSRRKSRGMNNCE